jgi:hypothetical protein
MASQVGKRLLEKIAEGPPRSPRRGLVVEQSLLGRVHGRVRERVHRAAVGVQLPIRARLAELARDGQHLLGRSHRIVEAVQDQDLRADFRLRTEARRMQHPVHAHDAA